MTSVNHCDVQFPLPVSGAGFNQRGCQSFRIDVKILQPDQRRWSAVSAHFPAVRTEKCQKHGASYLSLATYSVSPLWGWAWEECTRLLAVSVELGHCGGQKNVVRGGNMQILNWGLWRHRLFAPLEVSPSTIYRTVPWVAAGLWAWGSICCTLSLGIACYTRADW